VLVIDFTFSTIVHWSGTQSMIACDRYKKVRGWRSWSNESHVVHLSFSGESWNAQH